MTGDARAGADVILRVLGAGMGCGSMGAGAASGTMVPPKFTMPSMRTRMGGKFGCLW